MTPSLLIRYKDKIAGVLSCYDRVVLYSTLPGLCYAAGMAEYLSAQGTMSSDADGTGDENRCAASHVQRTPAAAPRTAVAEAPPAPWPAPPGARAGPVHPAAAATEPRRPAGLARLAATPRCQRCPWRLIRQRPASRLPALRRRCANPRPSPLAGDPQSRPAVWGAQTAPLRLWSGAALDPWEAPSAAGPGRHAPPSLNPPANTGPQESPGPGPLMIASAAQRAARPGGSR